MQRRIQVDQEIAAGQEVQFRERGIREDVVRCKDHHIPNFFGDTIAMILFEKEPRQTIGPDVGGNPFRIEAHTGGLNGLRVQIRRKYLDLAPFRRALEAFVEEDAQRIGFLTARTARDPHADVLVHRLWRQGVPARLRA